jgi:uncharacterized cupredoxin-like copper-binding protein
VTPTGTPAAASTAPASAAATTAASPGAVGNTLAMTAKEYAFEGANTTPAGLTTVTLKNSGQEEHQAQLARIADNATLQQLTEALKNPDPSAALKMITLSGGPAGVAPGATGSNTINLAPGQYVFLCFVPGPDGIPHLAKGMVAPLQVTGTASTAELPAAATTVNAKDFSFEISSTTLKAGKQTLQLVNNGPQPHEAQLVKLASGVTVDQLRQMMTSTPAPGATQPAGPPPFTAAGGAGAISAGAKENFELDLTAGNYAFLCFIPDPASGREHFSLGMIAGVTVQ